MGVQPAHSHAPLSCSELGSMFASHGLAGGGLVPLVRGRLLSQQRLCLCARSLSTSAQSTTRSSDAAGPTPVSAPSTASGRWPWSRASLTPSSRSTLGQPHLPCSLHPRRLVEQRASHHQQRRSLVSTPPPTASPASSAADSTANKASYSNARTQGRAHEHSAGSAVGPRSDAALDKIAATTTPPYLKQDIPSNMPREDYASPAMYSFGIMYR